MGHFFAYDPHLLIFLCHHQNHLVVREIEGVVCSRSPGLINPYPPGWHNLGLASSKNSKYASICFSYEICSTQTTRLAQLRLYLLKEFLETSIVLLLSYKISGEHCSPFSHKICNIHRNTHSFCRVW